MEGSYPVLMGGQQVGDAAVHRDGLYLCFSCRCRFSGEMICRLVAEVDGKKENLGIPVPEGDCFHLQTRVPAKRLGEGELTVRAVPKHSSVSGKFVPLSPQEPFRYLKELKNAYLEIRNGQAGIVLREETPGAERI